MSVSLLRATGRLLLPVTAAVLLAGVSLEAGAYGDKGRIALQVGGDVTSTFFVYQTFNGGVWTDTSVVQGFTAADRGCTIWESGSNLVNLVPNDDLTNGLGATSFLGFGPTSIGVYDGPTGVPCSRVSILKKTTETLGARLPSGGVQGANAFDRLELDLEVKGNALIELTVTLEVAGLEARERVYELRTGSNVTADGVSPDGFEADGSNLVFNCSSASDSGNDSGFSDNCRWIINDWGQSFTIRPIEGEFSLEGAGDWGLAGDERSFIYLADIKTGPLNCGESVSTATSIEDAEYCKVSLLEKGTIDPADCEDVPYALLYNEDRCEFYSTTEQLIANVEVVYEAEAAPTLDVGPPSMPSAWVPARLSSIVFGGNKSQAPFPIPPCLGLTLIPDGRPDVVGPAPIPEVESLDLDLIDGNNTIEFACAFSRSETYQTNMDTSVLEVVIKEGVQFWSDPVLVRGGER